jgi:diguanylate cyclase
VSLAPFHTDHEDVGPSEPRALAARRELLERVHEFVLKHDLAVNGYNLAAICNALSGSSSKMAEAFATREMSGQPIDQRWLDSVMRLDPETGHRMAELEKLMDQLEYALMRFAQTARSAKNDTSEQRGAIHAQIAGMGVSDEQDRFEIAQVITASRAILARIESVEKAMARSEAETTHLRAHLAKARIEADVDHLTKLPNRRAFERRLASAAQRAQLEREPLCVAFCDVDHFKAVNDDHGHDAGDRVLVAIASLLSEHASHDCFIARQGGEEFVMLLFGFEADAAWRKLDGIRRAQASKRLLNRDTGQPFGKITFSAGLAEVQGIHDTRAALGRADAALYRAKRAGRDRVETYREEMERGAADGPPVATS